MAQILISEPHPDVQRLLERMLTRMGHEPVTTRVPTPAELTSADLLIVEPASPVGAVLAQAASLANPSLPLICASVAAPPTEIVELGVVFAASLLKPFTAEQVGDAIDGALRARRGRPHPRDPWLDDRAA